MSDTLSPDVPEAVREAIQEYRMTVENDLIVCSPATISLFHRAASDLDTAIQHAIAEAVRHERERGEADRARHFTSEDVRMCRIYGAMFDGQRGGQFCDLADRIAALLPTGSPSVASEGPDTTKEHDNG